MPKFAIGNMWDEFARVDLFCITTNSYIRNDGALVMGRGIAKVARDKFPGLALEWGQRITRMGCANGVYRLLLDGKTSSKLAAFQVKTHYRNKASPEVIRLSAIQLAGFANMNLDYKIALNYPGIGYGRLGRDVVAPLLEVLPNNVTVWSF
jgi:hypothetical protein